MSPAKAKAKAKDSDWRSVLNLSEGRLAGYCSILLAATYVLVVLYYELLPGHPRDANGILKDRKSVV